MLALASCGGSSNNPDVGKAKDGGTDVTTLQPDAPVVKVNVSPASVTFDSTVVGEVSTPKQVTVAVTGGTATINPTVVGGDFVIDSTTCGTASASCTITVKFGPGSIGLKSGVLNIQTGLSVSLSGQGVAQGSFSVRGSVVPSTVLVNAVLPVTVTVTATVALSDLTCQISGSDLTADAAKTTCTAALAAATPCVYAYNFKSATAGVKSDAIICTSKGVAQTVNVAPTVVTPAALTISPPSASFSSVIGQSSTAITLYVANAGGTASGNLTAALTGAGAADFAIGPNQCVVPLAPLTTCQITLTFKPTGTAAGNRAATLTVTDATVGSTPATASLSGVAVTPSAVSILGSPTFAPVLIGSSSPVTTFTVTNSGGTATGSLAIDAGDAQFVKGSDLCAGLPLAAGKTCTFTVTFTPTKAGVTSSLLSATADGALLATLQISGTGNALPLPATLSMTPPTMDFGTTGVNVPVAPKTFTVTNTGATATLALSVVKNDSSSSTGGASQFTYTTTCSGTLAPLASCQVVVTFAPTIGGNASAIIKVSDTVVSTTAPTGTVTGTALDRPGLTLLCNNTGTVLTAGTWFEDTVVGTTSGPLVCTVSNATGSEQATGALTLVPTAEFAVASTTCGPSLDPGLSCTVTLTFTPTTKGIRTGTLTVRGTNAAAANRDLSGTGLGVVEIREYAVGGSTSSSPWPLITAGNFDFGSVSVGATSTKTVTLGVFVRGETGDLAITKTFGVPEEFTQVTTAGLLWGATLIPDCAAITNTVVVSKTVPFCAIKLVFTPKSKGDTKTGTIVALGGDKSTDTATVKGKATGPISVTPSTLTFSTVGIGSVGTALTLSVCNSAGTPATLANFSITGPDAADFVVTVDQVTDATIIGGTCKLIELLLSIPSAATASSISATLTANATVAGVIETDSASLIGTTATAPLLAATLASETFGATAITGTSSANVVTIKNNGATGTDVINIDILGGANSEFTMTGPGATTHPGTCPLTCSASATATSCTTPALAGGASCTVSLWLKPTSSLGAGPRTDALEIRSDMGGIQVLKLSGTATAQFTATPAAVVVGPSGLSGAAPTPTQTITVTNLGAAIAANKLGAVFTDISGLGQNGAAKFTVDNSACLVGLGAPGSTTPPSTCTITVSLGNAALAGTYSTTLVLTNNDTGPGAGQEQRVLVSGTAANPALLALTAATNLPYEFGNVPVGGTGSAPVKFTVVNNGQLPAGPMTFGIYESPLAATPVVSASFLPVTTGAGSCVSGLTAGTVLNPGETCNVWVNYVQAACTALDPSPCTGTKYAVLRLAATPGVGATPVTSLEMSATPVPASGILLGQSESGTAPYVLPYDFGTATSVKTATLRVVNPTSAPFVFNPTSVSTGSLTSTSISSSLGGEFSILTGGSCGTGTGVTVTQNGGQCSLIAQWKPTTVTGTTTATSLTTSVGTRGVAMGLTGVLSTGTATASAVASMNLYARLPAAQSLTVVGASTLDFGSVNLGVASAAQSVVVKNTGERPTLALASPTGTANFADLTLGGTCLTSPTNILAVGATCTLTVVVTSSGASNGGSVVSITDGVATPAPVTVTWSTTVKSKITPNPTTIDFGNQAVLSPQAVQAIALSNVAAGQPTGPLSFSINSPDFSVSAVTINSLTKVVTPAGTDCGAAAFVSNGLGAGLTCNIFVWFTPNALATPAKTGTLTIKSANAADVTIVLNGTAIADLSVSGAALAIAAEDPAASGGCTYTAATATALPSCAYGTANVALSDPPTFKSETFTFVIPSSAPDTGLLLAKLGGTDAGQFRIVNDNCTGVSLPVTGPVYTCAVTVRFAPSAAGVKAATLTVSGTPGDSATVNLTATAN
jgi:hypothetical protein